MEMTFLDYLDFMIMIALVLLYVLFRSVREMCGGYDNIGAATHKDEGE